MIYDEDLVGRTGSGETLSRIMTHEPTDRRSMSPDWRMDGRKDSSVLSQHGKQTDNRGRSKDKGHRHAANVDYWLTD